jgi:hypothetical protein
MKYLKWLALLSAGSAWSLCAVAAPVTELAAGELAGFVARHEHVVVQFTSPDWNCTYCIGADRTFDGAAAASTDPGLVFARIQWPRYQHVPDLKPLVGNLWGMPAHIVFKNGSVHRFANGRPFSAQLLLRQFGDMLGQPAEPGVANKVYSPAPSRQPLTVEEQRLVDLDFRRIYLDKVVSNCGRHFPEHHAQYRTVVRAWQERRWPELDQAITLQALHTGATDAATINAIFAGGHKAMGQLQVRTVGHFSRPPSAQVCTTVIEDIVALP